MKVRELAYISVLAALTCVCTAFIPTYPLQNGGYVHFGDAIIVLAAYLFGKRAGAFVGAIGSTTADIILGVAFWAPYTFIIKLVLGFLFGVAYEVKSSKMKVLVYFLGCIFMTGGYYIAEVIITSGNFIAPLYSIYGSVIQYIISLLIGLLLGKKLKGYVKF